MKWYKELFIGESLSLNAKQVIKKIKKRHLTPGVYIVAFASNSMNLLDIIPTTELLQKGYPKEELYIIGLAFGMKEAKELVRQIVDETYQSTGGIAVKDYLLIKWREESWT